MMSKVCKCPYIPCKIRGNCQACIEKSVKEGSLSNCMEEIAMGLGAQLPLKIPETVITRDYEDMSVYCARMIADQVKQKPESLICLPAGSTAKGTFEALKVMQDKKEVDFSSACFVALDEWLDLEDESENCTSFMNRNFYEPLRIKKENIRLFDIHAEDLEEECKSVDRYIFEKGGIDFMLLGLGMNGHLGLNEPGNDFDAYAKVVQLSETTMNVGQKYFSGPVKLTRGITLGIRHMYETRKVVLQVSGEKKQDIVYNMYHSQPTQDLPGTVLKLLNGAVVVLDEDAAGRIKDLLQE